MAATSLQRFHAAVIAVSATSGNFSTFTGCRRGEKLCHELVLDHRRKDSALDHSCGHENTAELGSGGLD